MSATKVGFTAVSEDDFEDLLALRILVMRPHLERLERFHPDRARKRFKDGFQPDYMRKIWFGEDEVGVVSVKPHPDGLEIEHFYLHPDYQNLGIGGKVLSLLMTEADDQNLALHLGVLKDSPAAQFYERYGFEKTAEDDWDLYYRREIGAAMDGYSK